MDSKDLKTQLQTLFASAISETDEETETNGSGVDDIVAGLLGTHVAARSAPAESVMRENEPPVSSTVEARESQQELAWYEVPAELPEEEMVPETPFVEPPASKTSKEEPEMTDSLAVSFVTEETDHLPLNPTDHPLYQDLETAVNQGDWRTARVVLTELLGLYPDDAYLREIAAFVHTRSILVEAAPETTSPRTSLLRRSLRFIIPVAIVLALLGIVVVALLALQIWILPRATEERQRAQITEIREEARTALDSGDYDRAMIAYNRILNLLPDDREARDGLEQAGELRATASVYSEAIAEMEGHHWENALSLLYQIQEAQPGYRDVEERIVFVQEQQALSSRFDKAEAAFDRGYFELAIQEYEALQSEDSGFQRETVQDHLFLSYLQLGLAEEDAAGNDVDQLESALAKLEKALTLRPDDSQARGESQLLRLYIAGLDQIEAGNWPGAVDALTPVYEARPDFAAGAAAQQLYDAQVAWADELYADGQIEEALAKYREARLVKDVQSEDLDGKIAMAEQMLATPTPAPEAAQAASTPGGAGEAAAARGPAPTPTPLPPPYNLKGMSVKPNCDGRGYIHGVVWSAYNMPMSGIIVQAINTTTGFGPLVSLPTNADGIYQIVLEKDWIDGLWVVQVLENGQPASQAWGQHLGGGCVNGAQELKVDWQRTRDIQ